MPRRGGILDAGESLGRRVVEAGVKRALGVDLEQEQTLRSQLVEAVGAARLAERANRRLGWLALHALSRWTRGQDLDTRDRMAVAKQVRYVASRDAQTMYAVRLRIAFCFGRGVTAPKAADEDVQAILDGLWETRVNRAELFEPAAQWRFGKDLYEVMNVYFVVFAGFGHRSRFGNRDLGADGRVLLGSLQHDQVVDVQRDPQNWRRVLWYVVKEYVYEWDYAQHGPKPDPKERTVYYEALEGMAELEEEIANGRTDLPAPPAPNLIRPGRIMHVATNRGRESAFGLPELRTNLKWASAFNDLLGGQVEKAKAAQSFLMKVTAQGARTEEQLTDVALRAVGRRSPLANADLDLDAPESQTGRLAKPGSQFWQNDSLKAEPFDLDSGGQAAKADLESASHAFAAGTNYPAHYFFGDPGSLAGSMAVELPVLKLTDIDQELVRGVLATLCELAIENAVRSGLVSRRRAPTDDELEAKVEVGPDGMVERDLSYELKMPDALRRNLPELMQLVADVAATFDPTATSPTLNRALLGYALDLLDMSDSQALVERFLAEAEAQAKAAEEAQRALAAGDRTSTGPDGQQHDSTRPNGERKDSQAMVEAALHTLWREVQDRIESGELVTAAVEASANGAGH